MTHGGDLYQVLGHPAVLSIEDDENAWFELGEVRLCNSPPPEMVHEQSMRWLEQADSLEALKSIATSTLMKWRDGRARQ